MGGGKPKTPPKPAPVATPKEEDVAIAKRSQTQELLKKKKQQQTVFSQGNGGMGGTKSITG